MVKEMTNESHNSKRGDKSYEKKKIVFESVLKFKTYYSTNLYIYFIYLYGHFPKKKFKNNGLQMELKHHVMRNHVIGNHVS